MKESAPWVGLIATLHTSNHLPSAVPTCHQLVEKGTQTRAENSDGHSLADESA